MAPGMYILVIVPIRLNFVHKKQKLETHNLKENADDSHAEARILNDDKNP